MQKLTRCLPRNPEVFCDTELRKLAFDLHRPLDSKPGDLVRLEPRDIAPMKKYAPAVGGKQARNEVEKRGLARTVRADDRMQPAAGKAQAEVVDCGQPAKSFGQILSSQSGLGHGSVRRLVLIEASLPRSPQRASRSFHKPTNPFGARMTTRMAMTPTIKE